ncbi:MAG: hypothetical protein PHH98_02705 [Candidatus Gracilibacteria bacterium]|nr:hypothetical protein [Candidatus Gracilibacteria bacterium]
MTDIFDIKGILVGFNFSILNFFILGILIIAILVYFFIRYRKKTEVKIEEYTKKQIEIYDFKSILDGFKERYLNLEQAVFLKETNHIFRLFIEQEKGYNAFSKLTLEEILSFDLEENYIVFLKDLYYKEYSEQVLYDSNKKIIFDNLVKIISNSK